MLRHPEFVIAERVQHLGKVHSPVKGLSQLSIGIPAVVRRGPLEPEVIIDNVARVDALKLRSMSVSLPGNEVVGTPAPHRGRDAIGAPAGCQEQPVRARAIQFSSSIPMRARANAGWAAKRRHAAAMLE